MTTLKQLHTQLVKTDSTETVETIQNQIITYLQQNDENPRQDTYGNIIAQKGNGKPHYILNTHFDTVPPHIQYREDSSNIYGRGASDAKGALAVFLHIYTNISITDGTLTLALTPDEETTTQGAQHLAEKFAKQKPKPTGFIIGEPTNLDICTATKGYFEGEIILYGKNAHSSQPEDGINAVTEAAETIKLLENYDEIHANPPHPELGNPILTPTIISGGDAINQIPDKCTIQFSRRGVPPETKDVFLNQLRNDLNTHLSEDTTVSINTKTVPFLQPFDTDETSELVATFKKESNTTTRAFTAATEASHFAQFEAPIIIFGPGHISDEHGPVAHSDREYIPKEQLQSARTITHNAIQNLF